MSESLHVTDRACACGCGTLMLSSIVGRGWKYLRGHKPARAARSEHRRGAVSATSPAKMAAFFDAQIEAWENQLRAREAEHRDAARKVEQIRVAIDELRANIQATKKLRGEVDAHFRRLSGLARGAPA